MHTLSISKNNLAGIFFKFGNFRKSSRSKQIKANEYYGFYSSWEEAKKQTKGYEDKLIFEKVKKAALAVKSGKALFERDSVLFYEKIYDWPLLAILLKIAYENNDKLNLVDYGGSLGSTFFQHRRFLSNLDEIRWNIIEQKHFVNYGKKHLSTKQLKFYFDLSGCLKNNKPLALLASGVLEYLENPFEVIKKIISFNIPNIIIDLTPFISSSEHKILIQKVSPLIYDASYPMWAFNFEKFIDLFKKDYKLEISFPSYCHTDVTVNGKMMTWKGIYFTRNA